LDTELDHTTADDGADTAVVDEEERPDENAVDEALGDEVIVEISVDGMCGVY
jgi:mycofactocin precursor